MSNVHKDVESISAEIIQILAAHRKESPEGWSSESKLADIGVDSFDFVEFVFLLEDRYGIEIDYNANQTVHQLETIGDVARSVLGLINARVAA